MDAPSRDHPNFRWTEGNLNSPPLQQNANYSNPPEHQSNWSGRNQERQNNWGNWNQGNQSNWANRNQNNPTNSYVPPHQRNYQGNNSNPQPNYQGNQGSGNQYNSNQGHQGNFHSNQGHGPSHHRGPSTIHPSARQPKSLDEMVNDLVSSQQHLQNNMQSNNDVVHKLQDAHVEHKTAMDMLAKQLSQIATSQSEMRGNEGRITATVKPPDRANISEITLRSK
ncbi:GATA zinc finger domain-containing protein 14-like [Salvia splendens]|uniref:GATA zinc finger domain-containing protein 14-like n=1 Tax=Salvia splendens TaxID=180675 RepID=UPI001C25949D|nr:GATA zinc finger domain-containing protein 14-like [Salvia splendens]